MLPFYYLREDKSFFVSVFIQDYDNAIIKRVFISISLGLAFHEWTYAHTTHTYRRAERPKRDREA